MLSLLNINSPINAKFTIPRSWSTARGDNRHGNRKSKSKSKSKRKSQLRGNILDVVSLKTSPGNKPRRVRFIVINDLGVIIETFTFRRIEDLLEQLGFACLLSLERNWRCRITRIIGRRFRRDTRIYLYNFLFFFFLLELWIRFDVRNGDEKMRKVLDKKEDWFVVVDRVKLLYIW